jgi:hypothetical protein
MATILLTIIIILLIVLMLICRQRKIGWFKPKPRVSFELQPLNNRVDSTPNETEMQERKKEKEERDAAPAYGEFVDESRL